MITATSVDVERVFSRGRQLLSYTRNRLSAESTRALLCLGSWIPLGLVKSKDIQAVTTQAIPSTNDEEEEEMVADGWARVKQTIVIS